jgi:hypothetical protein
MATPSLDKVKTDGGQRGLIASLTRSLAQIKKHAGIFGRLDLLTLPYEESMPRAPDTDVSITRLNSNLKEDEQKLKELAQEVDLTMVEVSNSPTSSAILNSEIEELMREKAETVGEIEKAALEVNIASLRAELSIRVKLEKKLKNAISKHDAKAEEVESLSSHVCKRTESSNKLQKGYMDELNSLATFHTNLCTAVTNCLGADLIKTMAGHRILSEDLSLHTLISMVEEKILTSSAFTVFEEREFKHQHLPTQPSLAGVYSREGSALFNQLMSQVREVAKQLRAAKCVYTDDDIVKEVLANIVTTDGSGVNPILDSLKALSATELGLDAYQARAVRIIDTHTAVHCKSIPTVPLPKTEFEKQREHRANAATTTAPAATPQWENVPNKLQSDAQKLLRHLNRFCSGLRDLPSSKGHVDCFCGGGSPSHDVNKCRLLKEIAGSCISEWPPPKGK